MELDRQARSRILARVIELVERKFFDPRFDYARWRRDVKEKASDLMACADAEAFECEMHRLVAALGVSHASFFHRTARRVPGRLAIGATFCKCARGSKTAWVFQDVHEGGPAQLAGVRRGDILIGVNGRTFAPPDAPLFAMGSSAPVTVQRAGGETLDLVIKIAEPRSRKLPYCEPRIVSESEPRAGIGLLKVSVFPGVVGIDVAREIDRAVSRLAHCRALVVDLRGNPGGGIGGLRLMSYLTPGRLPIGYSLTRRRAELGFDKEALQTFDAIPSSKWALVPLLFRFALGDKSIALKTEGLGPQPFHGAVAILVNEHTASASEMIAAFAAENRLATIIGTRTAGRLLSADSFKLPHGYVLSLPVGAYYTWQGRLLEGAGVAPDIEVELSYDALAAGADTQLESALDFTGSSSRP